MKKVVLFLSSTVFPRNIKCSGTSTVRKVEYLNAIQFYLSNTNFDLLIVDNSGYDYSRDFNDNRFESLSYIGNSSDEAKGKGYCESVILQYGFSHSKLLLNADLIVKITGRLIIKNINVLMKSCRNTNAVYADTDVNFSYAHTYFFVAPHMFFFNYLFPHTHEMNDSKGIHFEHVLGRCIKLMITHGSSFHQFIVPIYLIGHPGGSSRPYKKPSLSRYFIVFCKFVLTEIIIVLKKKRSNIL